MIIDIPRSFYRIKASLSNYHYVVIGVLLLEIVFMITGLFIVNPVLSFYPSTFLAFWTNSNLFIPGAVMVFSLIATPVLLVPLLLSFFSDYDLYEKSGVRSARIGIIRILGVTSFFIFVLAAPITIPLIMSNGGLFYMLYIIAILNPGSLLITSIYTRLYERFKFFQGSSSIPDLAPLYEPGEKPIKGFQINLDIGSVAPRIGAVVDGLDRWSKFFESSAPTSETIWSLVRTSGNKSRDEVINDLKKANASRAALSGLKKSAWRGVDSLRQMLADYLNLASLGQVLFVTSTTRALEVALKASAVSYEGKQKSAPEIVYILELNEGINIEHGSLLGRLEYFSKSYGTKVKKIKIGDLIKNTEDRNELNENITNRIIEELENGDSEFKTLVMSHVTSAGGFILPIERILIYRDDVRNFRLIVDAAHSVGQIEQDIAGKPDFFVFSAHKWLMGPASMGILILKNDFYESEGNKKRIMDKLSDIVYESLAFVDSDPDGERAATVGLDPFVGLSESVNIHTKKTIRTIQNRLQTVREIFRQFSLESKNIHILEYSQLTQAPGMVIIQKKGNALTIDGLKNAKNELEMLHQIIVKVVRYPFPDVVFAIRVCLPFYLSKKDVLTFSNKINNVLGRAV